MLKVIKNGIVYAPSYLGKKDILIGGGKILQISDDINISGVEIDIIDATDKLILPGFIDAHVHICGGGGEGGFKTRTPELLLSDMIKGGVTTVVGCLGTDGVSRTMTNLISKVNSLKAEGVSAYCYTGSYQLPVKTLTGDIMTDIMMVDPIIGIGEIAINDHRASGTDYTHLMKATADARVGGILSSKSGIVNVHLGDGVDNFDDIYRVVESSQIPIKQFYPTHVNRNPELFELGIEYAKKGGNVDFTTSTTDVFLHEGEVKSSTAIRIMLERGVSIDNITMTSDGQGSLPDFDKSGNLRGLTVGKCDSLYESVVDAVVSEGLDIEIAIKTITENPARILKLNKKGKVVEGKDADLVIVNKSTYEIDSVIALGEVMMREKTLLRKGTFE